MVPEHAEGRNGLLPVFRVFRKHEMLQKDATAQTSDRLCQADASRTLHSARRGIFKCTGVRNMPCQKKCSVTVLSRTDAVTAVCPSVVPCVPDTACSFPEA